MQCKFRKIIKFNYKGENYQLFRDSYSRLAFLKIDADGRYRYPELNDLLEITSLFVGQNDVLSIKKDSKFYKFTPKVIIAGVVCALSISFISSCANYYSGKYYEPSKPTTSTVNVTQDSEEDENDVTIEFDNQTTTNTVTPTPSTGEQTDYSAEAYNGTGVPDVLTEDVINNYLRFLAPADDEYDFRYETDYEHYELVNLVKGYDSSGYEQIFGHKDVTLDQIKEAIDKNPNISQTYKDFIYQYAKDLRTLYPDANLSVLHHNLSTLVIDELTQAEMNKETLSTDSAACYIKSENRICVLKGLDLSKSSDDYIVLVHELCHAARGTSFTNKDGDDVYVAFYDYYRMGTYAEEGIITNIAYELQGMGKRADFYPMQSSYYRIIMDVTGYSGADFFNHSVNYLIDSMNEYMGSDNAYQIVAAIDAQASLRYTPYAAVDFHDFQIVHDYIAEMYFKKYITPGMSYSEAEEVFDDFYENITHYFESMNRKYTITEDTFKETFENYCSQMGISNGKGLK